MKIVYSVSMGDVVAFNEFHAAHSPYLKRLQKRAMIMGPLGILWVFVVMAIVAHSWIPFVFGIIGAVLFAVIWPRKYRTIIQRSVTESHQESANKASLGQHELEITDTGITEKTSVGIQSTTWEGIEKIETTPAHVFIYIGSNMAHVVPISSVIEGNWDAFITELKKQKEQIN